MTKTYNDVDAVTRLLEEKETDLELAARIGQGLLARNQALEERLVAVDGELALAHDTVTQLRHDLSLKSELLQIYTNDLDDRSPDGVRVFTCDLLQRKVKGLEEDNRKLRAEASQLASDTSAVELREEQLMQDIVSQLSEANNHIRYLDDELAKKYEDSARQKEEITSLLNQLVSQRHKIRELTVENEELAMQLQVVRECQSELATELADYKDKYAEILDLLRDTQEQLKLQNRRNLPTASSNPSSTPYSAYNSPRMSAFHPDSLASELELSSLGSDGWMSDFSTCLAAPKNNQYQRVFDTVRCASSQLSGGGGGSGGSVSGGIPTPSTPSSSTPSHSRRPTRRERSATSLERTAILQSAALSLLAGLAQQEAPTPAVEVPTPVRTDYPSTSRIGVPGTPGTIDLTNALRRLSPKDSPTPTTTAREGDESPPLTGVGWRTPDSIMSTGSRSVYGGSYGCGFPEKLKIVKPIEGSTTLHNWSRLATPDFGSVLQDRPGVATRETEHTSTVEYSRDLLEMYSLLDVEEDEVDEMEYLACKSFDAAAPVYTLTTSTVLHPNDRTRTTSSLRGTCMSTSDRSAATSSGSVSPNSLACTTTYSTQQVLANALQERMADQPPEEDERLFCSGLSTPNNSPGSTPPDSPTPSSYGPIDLLQRGAKIIRRKWTGVETPRRRSRRSVPRIPKHEIQAMAKMNLMDKLEKLGLNQVAPSDEATVSPWALQSALQQLYSSRQSADDADGGETGRGETVEASARPPSVSGLNAIAQIDSLDEPGWFRNSPQRLVQVKSSDCGFK